VSGELVELLGPCGTGAAGAWSSAWAWREQGAGGGERFGQGSGVEAIVPDLVEAVGKDVEEEAAKELDGVEGDGAAVFGAEGDGIGGDLDEPGVGDGDAMGVAAEILEHVIEFPEGLFDVDDPGSCG
jgi:hypothetical protein